MIDLIEKATTLIGLEFQRMDGKKSIEQRRIAMKEFSANDNCTVMLASIDCVSLGYSSLSLSGLPLLTVTQARSNSCQSCAPCRTTMESHGRKTSYG